MWSANSKRPGRMSAGSSDSTKFVVPTTKTSSSLRKPSISVSSWLTIECSTPEPGYVPRAPRGGERVELVEHDDRRRRLARLHEHAPEVLLRVVYQHVAESRHEPLGP